MNAPTNPLGVGLHEGVPADVYHADCCPAPSLSSSVLRTMLSKSIEHAALEHPKLGGASKDSTPSMNLGSIVHWLLASGVSDDLVLGAFDNYLSKAARLWRDEVTASGKTPILERDLNDARPVADAVRQKAALGITNTPFVPHARSEVSAIWQEGEVFCRARYDQLVIDPNGYADIFDWKTTTDVSPRAIEKAIVKYGYHIQAAFYLRGLNALLPSHRGRTSLCFVFVESAPPYAVRRVVLSPAFLAAGVKEVSRGIDQWKHALATSQFTAPNLETLEVELPAFLEDDDDISAS